MVNAAGLAVLAIAADRARERASSRSGGPGDAILPNGWELVVLVAGCGLVAYGAVDRAPGPAYLGVANLLVFTVAAGLSADETLLSWPVLLLAVGLGVMVTGLRPRSPLPPEPSAYTTGDVPFASRTDEDDRAAGAR